MKLWSDSFQDASYMLGDYAFCVIDLTTHVHMSKNRNPHLAWDEVPEGTKSLALICCDCDVPSRGDDVNQKGKIVHADLPRVDFFHWTMIDIPVGTTSLAAGGFSHDITPRGKPGPEISGNPLAGARHGLNDYTGWFANDADMSGEYFGYDGPCPPWNDAVVHRYVFTLYALDIERLPVNGKFTGQQVREAIAGHVLDQADLTGLYTLNPLLAEPTYSKK